MKQSATPELIDSGSELAAAGLVHRVAQPATPGPYPTAVLIHGRAGNEDVMWVFRRAIPRQWLVVAPRAPFPDPEEGGYSWTQVVGDEWRVESGEWRVESEESPNLPVSLPALRMFDEGITAIERFVQSLSALYNADADRMVLMGFSQGAAVGFAFALRNPASLKGVASLVGFMPEGVSVEGAAVLRDLPVFMAVGREDATIPLEKARAAAGILRAAGADLAYHEYDTGHRLTAQGSRDLTAWWSRRG